jgi:predicted DNA-binding transcriptional regulator YafY
VAATAGQPDDEGWIHARVPIESISHAHEELLRVGAEIEVLAPHALRDRLTRTAVELARRYRN